MKKSLNTLILCIFSFAFSTLYAEIKLPHIFSDNMVLQCDKAIKVWGWADKNETIEVSFLNQVKKVKADKNGNWSIQLAAVSHGGPYTMEVKGKKNTITLKNILVGEVWLCSGQSNMAWQVKNVTNAKTEIDNADYPQIRAFNVVKDLNMKPKSDFNGTWAVCSPATAGEFSAVAYFFARKLHQELNIPIGIINSSWGGTGIETWTSPESFEELADKFKEQYKDLNITDLESDKAKLSPNMYSSLLYNSMINPITQFTIGGAIWYQGEHNAAQAYNYRTLFPNMITDWRTKWGYEFPFYWVQLANFMAKDDKPVDSEWAELREAQTMTLSLPKTGEAVITDIGEAGDIHPRNKQDVGIRLALNALNKDYGKTGLVYSVPTFKSMDISGNKVVISFNNIGKGLKSTSKYGYIEGFAIAGADNKFVWAKAYIDGDKVVAYSDNIPNPVSVRYSWSNNPDVNLFNEEGLPAAPFRTDCLKGITQKD
ncbi:MAG: sialate O-acetylesterase [Prevotella sp.]|jgi:sialate O-acetylesterase|nr:sialate O-acetylesterase [Prevotella sp.]